MSKISWQRTTCWQKLSLHSGEKRWMGSSHQTTDPDDPQWMATSLCIEPFSDDNAQRQCQFTQIFKQPTEIKPFFLLSYLSQWKIQINPISQQNDQISKQAPGTDGRLGPWELLFPAAENWVHLTVPWLARVLNKPFIAATATRQKQDDVLSGQHTLTLIFHPSQKYRYSY